MRTLWTAGAVLVLVAGAAPAQERVIRQGPGSGLGSGPGATYDVPGRYPAAPAAARPTSRWGSSVDGRWWGGANAPGGWAAYRRPARGYVLPTYWDTKRFGVADWRNYGLSAPPAGYSWVRYYDDAVLVDRRGSVWDVRYGLDWDGYGGSGYAFDDRAAYDGFPDGRERDRRDNGLGGAAVGAVAGGVAGNLIAGRGDRLGGTLIGAGVGAAAGYAIDKNEDRGRRGPPPRGYASGYPTPTGYDGAQGYAGGDYPVADDGAYREGFDDGYESGYDDGRREDGYGPRNRAAGGRWVSPDGLTTVTATNGVIVDGYHAAGHAPYGSGLTSVTVQTQPVVTTTTTEYYEDRVTYTKAPKRVAKRVYRRRSKMLCRC